MVNFSLSGLLINAKVIKDKNEWNELVGIAHDSGTTLLDAVHKYKKVSFLDLALLIAENSASSIFNIQYLNPDAVSDELNVRDLEVSRYVPLKKDGNSITVLCSDPSAIPFGVLKFTEKVSRVNVVIVEDDKLTKFIQDYIKQHAAKHGDASALVVEMMQDLQETPEESDIEDDVINAPVVRFINGLLREAINMNASDIHLEPYEETYRVRCRVDGRLFELKRVPVQLKSRLASRVKIMSNLDITEKRLPQDGRFKLKFSEKRLIDIRVSSLPTLWGEKIVMRILDNSNTPLDLDALGYSDEQKTIIMQNIKKPYGMILVTGPTGSGKTVSLYTFINILNQEGVNICTVEDPVEINLKGVNQVNINEKAGLVFENTLIAFLRQDPDIILVGEIRNKETATTAIQAAQTGHLLLSTIHTNDAPRTITRLIQMGIEPYNIASSLLMITSQRLLQKLCHVCKEIDDIPKEVLLRVGFKSEDLEGYGDTWHVYKGHGCEECLQTGYKGRTGVYQVMPINEKIKQLILTKGSDLEIEKEAARMGVKDLRASGLEKVKEGITSLSEVMSMTIYDD